MAESGDQEHRTAAYKLMLSIINYDLSSEPVNRRVSMLFDPDWQLYLSVAKKNNINDSHPDGTSESLAQCSCREFDSGKAKTDAFQVDRSLSSKFAREMRGLAFGANR